MLKTMKRFMCRVLAVTMALSAVSISGVSPVSAADETNVIWQQHYYQDFDKLTALEDSNEITYADEAVVLKNDSAGGQCIELTPANVTSGVKVEDDAASASAGKWSVYINAFDNESTADKIRFEYQIKFKDHSVGTGTGNWAPYSGMHSKIFATGRAWGARISPAATRLLDKGDTTTIKEIAASDNNNVNWYNVIYEFDAGTKTLVSTVKLGDTVIDTRSAENKGIIKGYLMGCDASGSGIYVDNIRISYGYNKPENFELNFNENEVGSVFANEKITMANVNAEIKEDADAGKCLSLKYSGDTAYNPASSVDSSVKNSVIINAFDNAEYANCVTISYKAKLGNDTTPSAAGDAWDGKSALRTKILGTPSNVWALQIRENLYQIKTAVRITESSEYISGWFTVKHELNQETHQLVTTVITADGRTLTDAAVAYSSAVTGFELINSDRSIVDEILIDDIKVTYAFGDETKAPESTVTVYAGDEVQTDLTAASTLTDKVVISFNEAVNTSTVTHNSVYIEDSKGNKVGCEVAFDVSCKVCTMTLPTLISAGTYKVVVTADVKSEAGAAAVAKIVEFTVASGAATLPPETYAVGYVIDFDDYETYDAAMTAYADKLINSGTTAALVDDGNGGRYLSVAEAANTDYFAVKNFANSETADTIIIEFDAKLSALDGDGENFGTVNTIATKINSSKAVRDWAVRLSNKRYDISGTTTTGTELALGWYTVKHVITPSNGTMITSITSEDGSQKFEGSKTVANLSAPTDAEYSYLGKISEYRFFSADGTAGTVYYDNIKISYTYNAPSVTENSVTFTDASGAVQENWNDIDLLTKAVKIDLGAVMDTATLNCDNVYITKKGDSAKVGYIAGYENGVYTMNLTEALKESTTYTLVVSKDVANVMGDKLSVAENVKIDFTTGKGKRTADLMAVKVNGSKVTGVSGLVEGASGQIEINYSNTTGNAQMLNIIIAYYAGDMLKTAELIQTENIDASIVAMTYKYDFDIPADMAGITSVKIMSWNSFGEMVPLSDSIDL